jgi:hypothetical protein
MSSLCAFFLRTSENFFHDLLAFPIGFLYVTDLQRMTTQTFIRLKSYPFNVNCLPLQQSKLNFLKHISSERASHDAVVHTPTRQALIMKHERR